MALTSTWSLSIKILGDGISTTFAPVEGTVLNAAAPEGVPLYVTLSSGANSLPVPAGAQMLTLFPPIGNAVTLSVGGLAINPGLPFSTGLPVGTTSLTIAAGGPLTVKVAWT